MTLSSEQLRAHVAAASEIELEATSGGPEEFPQSVHFDGEQFDRVPSCNFAWPTGGNRLLPTLPATSPKPQLAHATLYLRVLRRVGRR